jgi:hypothetical protein
MINPKMQERLGWILLIVLVALAFIIVGSAHAQSKPRVFIDAKVGGGSIGFNPSVDVGASVEAPLGEYLELDAAGLYSPLTKFGYSGHTWQGSGSAVQWIRPKIGIVERFHYSHVDFGATEKSANDILAGIVLRTHWNPNMPGRVYLMGEYELGGCVWNFPGKPCPLTSSRFRGGSAEIEFRMASRLRFGLDITAGRINQQINPACRPCGPIYGFAVQAGLVLRFTPFPQSVLAY